MKIVLIFYFKINKEIILINMKNHSIIDKIKLNNFSYYNLINIKINI